MKYKLVLQLFCGLSSLILVACSGSSHSNEDKYKPAAQNDHCPTLSALHLDKLGYMTAPGGWRSKTIGHSYVLPPDFQPNVSGWAQMKVVGFIQADAFGDIDRNKLELKDCVYQMALSNDVSRLRISMYLLPTKKHIADARSHAWNFISEFFAVCRSDDSSKNNPEHCVFSS